MEKVSFESGVELRWSDDDDDDDRTGQDSQKVTQNGNI